MAQSIDYLKKLIQTGFDIQPTRRIIFLNSGAGNVPTVDMGHLGT